MSLEPQRVLQTPELQWARQVPALQCWCSPAATSSRPWFPTAGASSRSWFPPVGSSHGHASSSFDFLQRVRWWTSTPFQESSTSLRGSSMLSLRTSLPIRGSSTPRHGSLPCHWPLRLSWSLPHHKVQPHRPQLQLQSRILLHSWPPRLVAVRPLLLLSYNAKQYILLKPVFCCLERAWSSYLKIKTNKKMSENIYQMFFPILPVLDLEYHQCVIFKNATL